MARNQDSIVTGGWARNGDKAAPPVSYNTGWTSEYSQEGGPDLRRTTFNQLYFQLFELMDEVNIRGGGLEWDTNISYVHPALVTRNATVYISVRDNQGVDPATDTDESDWFDILGDATSTRTGVNRIATLQEVLDGASVGAAVPPNHLASRTATDTRTGLIRQATVTEIENQTGSGAVIASRLSDLFGTQAEIDAGNANRVVTGATLQGAISGIGLTPITLSVLESSGTISIPSGATRALVRFAGSGGGDDGAGGTSTLTATGISVRITGGGRGVTTSSQGSHGIATILVRDNILGSALSTRGGGADGTPIGTNALPGRGGYAEFYIDCQATGNLSVTIGAGGAAADPPQPGNRGWVTVLFF